MAGKIYISGVYDTVVRNGCSFADEFIDNDPHFYRSPPTWGICRSDLRKNINIGDYVFFTLPIHPKNLPQMIYGYMRVAEKISHLEAYNKKKLRSKRMGNRNPNGNIIVDANGRYNIYDRGIHYYDFDRIKKYYIVGDIEDSEYLTTTKIKRLAPDFQSVLNSIFGKHSAKRPVDIITRKGRNMTAEQVVKLKEWIES